MKPINNVLRVVDEYSKWLSHEFPEVGRVLDNLHAELSGEGLNAGTPGTADNCVISSLREQLRRNRAALAAPTPGAQQKAASLIIELEAASERFTRYSNDSIDGLLQAAADVIRALAAPSTPASIDPMDWPLPCDVVVGHGTMRKGVSLLTLVLRMKTLYEMATGNNADEVASRTPEQRKALLDAFIASTQAAPSTPAAEPEPVAWRTRYRSEAGMIGHYPWSYTERIRGMRLDQYEYEPLYASHPASPVPEAPTVEQAIASLVTALAASKGWMRDYADSVVRDAVDRKPEAMIGYKLVPIEPTPRMIEAMAFAWQKAVAEDDPNECVAEYHAALAAAPGTPEAMTDEEIVGLARDHGASASHPSRIVFHVSQLLPFARSILASSQRNRAAPAAPNEGLSHLKPAAMKREMTDTELAALNARELALQAIERKERVAWVRGHSAGWDAALKNEADAGGSDVK